MKDRGRATQPVIARMDDMYSTRSACGKVFGITVSIVALCAARILTMSLLLHWVLLHLSSSTFRRHWFGKYIHIHIA